MLSDRFEFEMFPSVSLFGKIIPMYGLCMVLGIILSCSAAFARAKKFKLDINNLIVIAAAAGRSVRKFYILQSLFDFLTY